LGMVVAAPVHSTSIQDRDGAKPALKKLVGRFPRLKKILAGEIHNNGWIAVWAKEHGGCWIFELVVCPGGKDVRGTAVALGRRADVRLARPLTTLMALCPFH
jgi:hypothetical protein